MSGCLSRNKPGSDNSEPLRIQIRDQGSMPIIPRKHKSTFGMSIGMKGRFPFGIITQNNAAKTAWILRLFKSDFIKADSLNPPFG
jgi:hypothetical protein